MKRLRTTFKIITMSVLTSMLLSACSVIGARPWEQPEYEVAIQDGNIEVREYSSFVMITTVTSGSYGQSTNNGFQILIGYLTGENKAKESIDMTTPVIQEQVGQKIDMTAPVIQEQSDDGWMMGFVLPLKFSKDNAPEPLDSRIKLVEVPERLVAAIRFSGRTNTQKMSEMENQLRDWLEKNEYEVTGEVISARYDPPWTLPMLRRNEMMLEVKVKDQN